MSTAAICRAWLIDAALLLLAVSPLLLTAHLPLSDLPNHLARQYILRDWADSPALQSFYTYHWTLVPNLALELFVLPLRAVVPLDLAVRLFCIATVALLCVGTRAVNRILGGPTAYAYRTAPLLCYGGPFQFGFLSYCFGIGLALLLFAAFLRLRDRALGVQAAILLPGGVVLLLCHLAAFGIFAACVGTYEISCALDRRRTPRETIEVLLRRMLGVAFLLLPPLLLFLLAGPHEMQTDALRWGTPHDKAEAIMAITLFASPLVELALLAAACVVAAIALAVGALRVHRHAVLPLIALAALTLVLPRSAMGAGYLDYRIPWAASFFAVASLVPGAHPGRLRTALMAAFAGLSFARIALIAVLWLRWEPIIAGIDAGFSALPVGARMMVVLGEPASTTAARAPSLLHIAAYAVARRQAFEPSVYAGISGQILDFQPAAKPHWALLSPSSLDRIDPYYTHLLVLRPSLARIGTALMARLKPIAQGRDFILYAVEPAPASG